MLPLPRESMWRPNAWHGQVRALDVEVEDRVEPLLGEVLRRAAEGRARAVDEDVDRPSSPTIALGRRLDRLAVGHVAVAS